MNAIPENPGQLIKAAHEWYARLPAYGRLFLLTVIVPTLLMAVYAGLIVTDVYTSEARFAIRTLSQPPSSTGLLNNMLAGFGMESPGEDAMIVRDYILSRDMLDRLDNELGLKQHYQSGDVDITSRLDGDATHEEFLEFYRGKIEVGVDTASNSIIVRAHAFAPLMAQQVAETIIHASEDLVNRLSDRMLEDSLRFARSEVENSERRVRAASDAITIFRNNNQSINPGEETSAVLGIVTELETQLAAARAELIQARNFMQADSPQVQTLRNKAESLEAQVKEERKRLASEGSTDPNFTRLIDDYQPLALEQELATQLYKSSLTSLELARIEAQRRQRYLLPYVNPGLADDASGPDRLRMVLVALFVLCLLYAIGGLVWAAIKDHMRI